MPYTVLGMRLRFRKRAPMTVVVTSVPVISVMPSLSGNLSLDVGQLLFHGSRHII